jgi:hypothetical protein
MAVWLERYHLITSLCPTVDRLFILTRVSCHTGSCLICKDFAGSNQVRKPTHYATAWAFSISSAELLGSSFTTASPMPSMALTSSSIT